jgi:putative transcriptional regulator
MNNFRRIRELLGMTQAAIGQAIGVTQGNVSFYEQGQTIPPAVAARLISVAKSHGHVITFDDVYREAESKAL